VITRALIFVAALALWATVVYGQVLPDPAITPGAVCVVDLPTLCKTKWGKDERHVTLAMKVQVAKSYGVPVTYSAAGVPSFPHVVIKGKSSSAGEFDHLASRENGGCDSVSNLWYQPYTGTWNAHMKDKLENKLHVEMCAGRIQPADAVAALVHDWRVAYCRYYPGPPCPLAP
jgi:hypothetical protein